MRLIKEKVMANRKWRDAYTVLCVTAVFCLTVAPAERKGLWLIACLALAFIGIVHLTARAEERKRALQSIRANQWFSQVERRWTDYLQSPGGKLDDYERINNFVRIQGTARFIWGDASGIEGYVTSLVGDVTGLKGDVSGLFGYVGNIYGDVSDLSGHVSGLQGDVSKLKGNCRGPLQTIRLSGNQVSYWSDPAIGWVNGLEGDLTGIHGNLTHIYGKVQKDLTGDVSLIWGDVSGLTGKIGSSWCSGQERGEVGRPLVYGNATGLKIDLTRFEGDLSLIPRDH